MSNPGGSWDNVMNTFRQANLVQTKGSDTRENSDELEATSDKNLSYKLKVNEFVDFTTSGFCVPNTEYSPDNVWIG